MDAFEYAVKETLDLEGGFGNDPDDRGGATNFGITQEELDTALERFIISGITHVQQLTPALAKAIYKTDYWHKIRLSEVRNIYVAAEMFDTGVNMGTTKAVLLAQKALNYLGESLAEDGDIGPKTIEALNRWSVKDERALLVCLNGFQFIRYVEIKKNNPTQVKFTRGWTKRIQGYKEV